MVGKSSSVIQHCATLLKVQGLITSTTIKRYRRVGVRGDLSCKGHWLFITMEVLGPQLPPGHYMCALVPTGAEVVNVCEPPGIWVVN